MDADLGEGLLAMFEDDRLHIVEKGDWTAESKYEYRDTIVEYQNKFYRISECRSGSYFSDYHYDEPTIGEVVPKEKTITVWEPVNA